MIQNFWEILGVLEQQEVFEDLNVRVCLSLIQDESDDMQYYRLVGVYDVDELIMTCADTATYDRDNNKMVMQAIFCEYVSRIKSALSYSFKELPVHINDEDRLVRRLVRKRLGI